MPAATSVITLAGGCFWCTEAVFLEVRGVLAVESGYANGHTATVDYERLCRGDTGYAEVVRVSFDPRVIALEQILEIFFAVHDPTSLNRQGADRGTQYRSGIYWTTPEQADAARALIAELQAQRAFGAPIVTEVEPLRHYWPAEAEHQDFFARHPYHGYCLAVAAPKVAKLRRAFAQHLKPDRA